MLQPVEREITVDAAGDYTDDTPEKFTGRFLGFHTKMGTMVNCTLTIAAVTAAHDAITETVRTLYTKAATGNTSFLPVKVNAVDNAGAAIAGVYEDQYLIDESIRITIAAGGISTTMDLQMLLDVERSATHR